MTTVKEYKGRTVPEGATHYDENGDLFYKETEKGLLYEIPSQSAWLETGNSREYNGNHVKPIPQEPETFVPVVGEECEYSIQKSGSFHRCKIVDIGEVGVYLDTLHLFMNVWAPYEDVEFRPITDRQKVEEWVNSKIDCNMDEAIMLAKLLDLGCLVIPDSDKC
ncbi:MAG: hypothetical protein COB36_11980 [Alphaproteobacteria bacterium]|nr:MAG: hypothetical protein COB36_11980 [Alphaproteobacteria bacterium]